MRRIRRLIRDAIDHFVGPLATVPLRHDMLLGLFAAFLDLALEVEGELLLLDRDQLLIVLRKGHHVAIDLRTAEIRWGLLVRLTAIVVMKMLHTEVMARLIVVSLRYETSVSAV